MRRYDAGHAPGTRSTIPRRSRCRRCATASPSATRFMNGGMSSHARFQPIAAAISHVVRVPSPSAAAISASRSSWCPASSSTRAASAVKRPTCAGSTSVTTSDRTFRNDAR